MRKMIKGVVFSTILCLCANINTKSPKQENEKSQEETTLFEVTKIFQMSDEQCKVVQSQYKLKTAATKLKKEETRLEIANSERKILSSVLPNLITHGMWAGALALAAICIWGKESS